MIHMYFYINLELNGSEGQNSYKLSRRKIRTVGYLPNWTVLIYLQDDCVLSKPPDQFNSDFSSRLS